MRYFRLPVSDYAAVLADASEAIGLPMLGFEAAFSPVPLLSANGMALIAYNADDPLLSRAISVLEEFVAIGVAEEITEAECVWVSGDA